MGLPLLLGLAGLAGAGGYVAAKGSSDEPREAVKDETPTATATQGQGTDGNGGQYEFSELEMNAPQQTFKSTNVAYLDKKLADGTANFWDALAAKQFLGMNLGEYGVQNINMNMNAKMQLKKDADTLNNLVEANNLLDRSVSLSQKNLGVSGALDRGTNAISNKFFDLDDNNAGFMSVYDAALKGVLKGQKGGRYSNQDLKEFNKLYGLGMKGEQNFMEQIYELKYSNFVALENQIKTLEAQGRPVPERVYNEYNIAKNSLNDLQKQIENLNKGGDFDYNAWNKTYGHDRMLKESNNQNAQNGYVTRQ